MKWIQLHGNEMTMVNTDHIAGIKATTDSDGNVAGSIVHTLGGHFYAQETPEEIMALIEGEQR